MPLTSLLGVAEASVIEEALFTQGCIQRHGGVMAAGHGDGPLITSVV